MRRPDIGKLQAFCVNVPNTVGSNPDAFGDEANNGAINSSLPLLGDAYAFRIRLRGPNGDVVTSDERNYGLACASLRYPPLPILVQRVNPKKGSSLVYNDGFSWIPTNGCDAVRIIPSTDTEMNNINAVAGSIYGLAAAYELQIAQDPSEADDSGTHTKTLFDVNLASGVIGQTWFGSAVPNLQTQGLRVFSHYLSGRLYCSGGWPVTVWVFNPDPNAFQQWWPANVLTPATGCLAADVLFVNGGPSGTPLETGSQTLNPWRGSRIYFQPTGSPSATFALRCEI